MATFKQKKVIEILAQGGSIIAMGRGVFTIRDEKKLTVLRCDYNTIFRLKHFVVKRTYKKSACWLLNKRAVIALRKNHSFKKIYLQNRKSKVA